MRYLCFVFIFCSYAITAQTPPIEQLDEAYYQSQLADLQTKFGQNKTIDTDYLLPCLTALSFYPELKEVDIRFIQMKKGATMTAAPAANFPFKRNNKRVYKIRIKDAGEESNGIIAKNHLSFNALVGVIGHELAHIADYHEKNKWQLFKVGFQQLSAKKVQEFERDTDILAVEHGLIYQLIEFQTYVLTQIDIPRFQERRKTNYLSLDELHAYLKEEGSTLKRALP